MAAIITDRRRERRLRPPLPPFALNEDHTLSEYLSIGLVCHGSAAFILGNDVVASYSPHSHAERINTPLGYAVGGGYAGAPTTNHWSEEWARAARFGSTSGKGSLLAWVNWDSPTQSGTRYFMAWTDINGYLVRFSTSGALPQVRCYYSGANQQTHTGTSTLPTSGLQHWAFTAADDTGTPAWKLYLDLASEFSTTKTTSIHSTSGNLDARQTFSIPGKSSDSIYATGGAFMPAAQAFHEELSLDQISIAYADPYWHVHELGRKTIFLVGAGAVTGTVSESVVTTSAESGLLTAVGTTSESVVTTSAESGLLAALGSVSESAVVTSTESGTIAGAVTGTVSESVVATSSESGLLAAVGTTAESVSVTDYASAEGGQDASRGWFDQRRVKYIVDEEDDEVAVALLSRFLH